MKNVDYLFWIIGMLIFSILYLVSDKWVLKIFKIKKDSVSFESAKIAIDRLATWTTWLTGLQTASIAAMGFLVKEHTSTGNLKSYGFFALLFFGGSIILSTWLLSSLPSIQQRLSETKNPDHKNDVYMMTIFSFIHLRVGRFTGLILQV